MNNTPTAPEDREKAAHIEQMKGMLALVYERVDAVDTVEDWNNLRKWIHGWLDNTDVMLQSLGFSKDEIDELFSDIDRCGEAKMRKLFIAGVREAGRFIQQMTGETAGEVRQMISDLEGLQGGLPEGKEEQLLAILREGFKKRICPTRASLAAEIEAFVKSGGRRSDMILSESVKADPMEAARIAADLIREAVSKATIASIYSYLGYLSGILRSRGFCDLADDPYVTESSFIQLRKALVDRLLRSDQGVDANQYKHMCLAVAGRSHAPENFYRMDLQEAVAYWVPVLRQIKGALE